MRQTDDSAPLLLGIDTGGTYTDAVLVAEIPPVGEGAEHDTATTVVATAKSPTTHHDLSIGICGAIDAVLADVDGARPRIELVSLSTTLATNALVEGAGRPVAAVIIGFDEHVLDRGGLRSALAGDPALLVPGGHDPHGHPRTELDLELLGRQVLAVADRVEAFAVVSEFSVRNPEHERAASDLIRRLTGRPVTQSHMLSARLDGPRRAVTAVLNARLVPVIDHLVATTERALIDRGIGAPLMVVRGDGSLVSAEFVRERPIETILSGPAASLVGAAHLTGVVDAVISDIGGTTTDLAVLRDGVPVVSDDGATVGGHRTMVTAVAMHTRGLGGDSEVRHDDRSAGIVLRIGPRRVVPVSLLATQHADAVHAALDRQVRSDMPNDLDGVFIVLPPGRRPASGLSDRERRLVESFRHDVVPAAEALVSAADLRIVERLARMGSLRISSFTPTDASHVLGRQSTHDADAARKAAELMARRRDRLGRPIATDASELAAITVETLVRRSAEAVLDAAFAHDGHPVGLATSPAVRWALDAVSAQWAGRAPEDRTRPTATLAVALSVPLVALGASAATYYPEVARLTGTTALVPTHAAVANAIGAVVGRVRITRTATVSSPQRGVFVVHDGAAPRTFTELDDAVEAARTTLERDLVEAMDAAGAATSQLTTRWVESTVEVGGTPMFVEGELAVTATGRPRHGSANTAKDRDAATP